MTDATSAGDGPEPDNRLIVVIDGKHYRYDWATRFEIGGAGQLALFDDEEETADSIAEVIYMNWDFLYWGNSPDDMPEREEVKSSARATASFASPANLRRPSGPHNPARGRP